MAKYEWSEVFMSIEGEAKYAGHPTAYVRFARCNFKCALFNNPNKEVEKDGYATLGFNPKDYKTLEDIPLIHKGCDSQYAVNPTFSHMWHKGDETELANALIDVLPNKTFETKLKPIILSLTGGEPTIRIKFWLPLLEKFYAAGMRHVLIETNCAAPLREKDVDALYDWALHPDRKVRVTWSNSPKLSVSGESWDDAICPEIAVRQRTWHGVDVSTLGSEHVGVEQYFKFVCDPSDEHFDEVERAMAAYHAAGVPTNTEVYIMPTSCQVEQQSAVSSQVAKMCMERGYIYCHRVHLDVFGNGVGT